MNHDGGAGHCEGRWSREGEPSRLLLSWSELELTGALLWSQGLVLLLQRWVTQSVIQLSASL